MKKSILKGARWIQGLMGVGAGDLREESPAGSHPRREDSLPAPGPILSPDRKDFRLSSPAPVHCPDPMPESGMTQRSASDELQMMARVCGARRMSVEKQMVELCQTYRSFTPPSRLQLFVWNYPKGSPPKAVYWVRLSEEQREFDHGSLLPILKKRPRWFKILKIRTREDLAAAIHWNGLDRHRKTVMSFYDSWRALNQSRSILVKGMQFAKLALKHHLASSARKEAPLEPLSPPFFNHLDRAGNQLNVMAWNIGRLVDRNLIAFEELAERTATLPVRLFLSVGQTAFDRLVLWEHVLSGRWRPPLSENSLKILNLSPQELAAVRLAVSECRALHQTLSNRLRIIRRAESRLVKAYGDFKQALQQCTLPKRYFGGMVIETAFHSC